MERRTIPRHLRAAAESHAGATWLLHEGKVLTYAEAVAEVDKAATALRDAGTRKGDRVLVTARNTAQYLLSWFALMDVGAVQVPVNPSSTRAELDGFVAQVRPAFVITDGELAPAFGGPTLMVDALYQGHGDGRGPADIDERDPAVMIPTSGTTGRSKLVVQTHLAYVMAGEGFPYWLQLREDDRLMTSLPLFHINAPAYSVLGSLAAGASLVLLPGFSASTFLDSARTYRATQFNSIGAMLEILMRQPRRDDDADNPVRLCYTGPSPTKERQLEIEARFGWEVQCGYALSETPYGLVWRHGTRPYGTLGSPRQHPVLGHINDARVMDEGREVAPGGTGELELRNPTIMLGYFEMPEETGEVIVDGWLRTGDLVTDNGDETYTFIGRKKQVLRRRGENLSPTEVEAVLDSHPDVAESAVIGVPSELSEEDIKAFVVPLAGHEIDVRALRAFAAERLARFKVPRYYEVVDDLPHTATGRLAKHRLDPARNTQEVDTEG